MADQKLTQLTEAQTFLDADIMYIVKDVGGTPGSYYITGAWVKAAMGLTMATTATAAGTTTLNLNSHRKQQFTGSTTQTVKMPVVSTLFLGDMFTIINNSTGTLTVNSSGSNLITTVRPGETVQLICILITGTTAASWHRVGYFQPVTAFTPTIIGTSVAGAGTYTTQLGKYYRMGNIVHFSVDLTWTAHTGSGNMRIAGLPFTSANDGMTTPLAITWSNITISAAGNKVQAAVDPNSTEIRIQQIADGAFSAVAIDTAATLRVSGWYDAQ